MNTLEVQKKSANKKTTTGISIAVIDGQADLYQQALLLILR
jgi:hypothetical protein